MRLPSRRGWCPDFCYSLRVAASAMNMNQSSPTQTQHPSPMPASEGFPGQPRTWFRESVSTQHVQFAFSEGCDCASYVAILSHAPDQAAHPKILPFGFSSCPGSPQAAIGRNRLSVKVSVKRYSTSQNLGGFRPISIELPNESAIFPTSGTAQQNYLSFTKIQCGVW